MRAFRLIPGVWMTVLYKQTLLGRLLTPTKMKRILFFVINDALFILVSMIFASILRFEFSLPPYFIVKIICWYPVFLLVKISLMAYFRVYSFNWSFVGINEFFSILKAMVLALFSLFVFVSVCQNMLPAYSLPRSVVLIDFLIASVFVMSLRILKRVYKEIIISDTNSGQRAVIIGAGYTGDRIARELIREKKLGIRPIHFIDDNPHKLGTFIQGIKVVGNTDSIPSIVQEARIKTAIIAIAQISHSEIRRIYALLRESGIENIKIVPSINKLPKEIINIKDLRDINLEDLMARSQVVVREDEVSGFISGKKVMVTGAAGSIGSEIVRQLLKFTPETIYALELDETELHDLELEIRKSNTCGCSFIPLLCDVRNRAKLEQLFEKHRPEVVFHAAAYKHVPLTELFPDEAVSTNIFGTQLLAELSNRYDVQVFVNISTDKAVNPTSLMGATKRIAELICIRENTRCSTKFVSVRFGNVLGSRGSVLTIFQNQIRAGGPVTITDKDMVRYFMSIPEAVLLVMQAASMGESGDVFILDMGEPMKILVLAEELIRLQGLEPYKDIDINFVGLRSGEKLYEELFADGESVIQTKHEKVFKAKSTESEKCKSLDELMGSLEKTLINIDYEEMKNTIRSYIKFFEIPR